MKLTKTKLKQLIKEELQKVLQEQLPGGVTSSVLDDLERDPTATPPPKTAQKPAKWPMTASLTGAPQAGPATAALQQKILDMLWSIANKL